MLPGQSLLISRCSTVTLQSLGKVCCAIKGSFIYQGGSASATWAGAGPCLRLAQARPPEDGESSRLQAQYRLAGCGNRRLLQTQALRQPTSRSRLQPAR